MAVTTVPASPLSIESIEGHILGEKRITAINIIRQPLHSTLIQGSVNPNGVYSLQKAVYVIGRLSQQPHSLSPFQGNIATAKITTVCVHRCGYCTETTKKSIICTSLNITLIHGCFEVVLLLKR